MYIVRFTPFVKTGTEAFILGSVTIKKDIRPNEIVKVVVSDYIFFNLSVVTNFNYK